MSEKRKILFMISGMGGGGAEKFLYNLVSGIDRKKYESAVVTFKRHGDIYRMHEERYRKLDTPLYHYEISVSTHGIANLYNLSRFICSYKPDIVKTVMYHANLIGGAVARLSGVKRIVWGIHHCNLDEKYNKRTTIAVAKLCGNLSRIIPDTIIFCSERSRSNHMQIGYDPAKSEYIPNGFDLQRFAPNRGGKDQRRQQYGIPVGAIAIGLIARFDPLKDHDNFIMAARLLHQRHPSTHFVLCGDGIGPGNTALLELMDRNRVADCFSLLGYRTDIPEVLSTLDLVASASRGEAFPLTIGEAMACAIPCVVTDVGDSATIVGNFGKVVPPGDPAALANAWEELILLGEDGRIRLGLEARERICKHYSIERCVDSYQNLFDRLCA